VNGPAIEADIRAALRWVSRTLSRTFEAPNGNLNLTDRLFLLDMRGIRI
jgi:hypothetical protein